MNVSSGLVHALLRLKWQSAAWPSERTGVGRFASCDRFLLPTRCLDLCSARYGNDVQCDWVLTFELFLLFCFFLAHSNHFITGENMAFCCLMTKVAVWVWTSSPACVRLELISLIFQRRVQTALSDHITFLRSFKVTAKYVSLQVKHNFKQ